MRAALRIDPATVEDVPVILALIRELADYEKLLHEVQATEADLRRTLFGNPRSAEVILARHDGTPVGFALFFHNYSTFLGKPGLYLEDLYVRPGRPGPGNRQGAAPAPRPTGRRTRLRSPGVVGPRLERQRNPASTSPWAQPR